MSQPHDAASAQTPYQPPATDPSRGMTIAGVALAVLLPAVLAAVS
ncbi:MAG TPA: hypothetical protein VGC67_13125 [Cellulomonas sp.]